LSRDFADSERDAMQFRRLLFGQTDRHFAKEIGMAVIAASSSSNEHIELQWSRMESD
jgi:hypothetical protein